MTDYYPIDGIVVNDLAPLRNGPPPLSFADLGMPAPVVTTIAPAAPSHDPTYWGPEEWRPTI